MQFSEAVSQFYFDITLNELRLMNQNTLYPHISYNSLLYLDIIAYKENCTVSYLARALHVSKPAVTAKVNDLMAQGLVEKHQSKTDKRVFHLTVSPAVREDYHKYDLRQQNATRLVQAKYTPEEISLFTQMLDDLRKEYTRDL